MRCLSQLSLNYNLMSHRTSADSGMQHLPVGCKLRKLISPQQTSVLLKVFLHLFQTSIGHFPLDIPRTISLPI